MVTPNPAVFPAVTQVGGSLKVSKMTCPGVFHLVFLVVFCNLFPLTECMVLKSLLVCAYLHRTCNIAISGSTIAPDREECNDFEPQHRGTSPNHPPFPAKIPANCLVIFSPTSHFLTWLGHAWGETDITASLRKNFLPQ